VEPGRDRGDVTRAAVLDALLQLLEPVAVELRSPLPAVVRLDLGAGGLQRLRLARTHLIEADQVVAELGTHRLADLSGLERIQRVGKVLHVGAAIGPAEIAAASSRARILGVLARQRGEILARLELRA
jgi:hypothetical protein